MDRDFHELLDEVLSLDRDSQIAIAQQIMAQETESPAVDSEWKEELRRRDEAYKRGEITLVDSKDVMDRARKKISDAKSSV